MVMEERKKKQVADCKKIANARKEVQHEVDIFRKELQQIVRMVVIIPLASL